MSKSPDAFRTISEAANELNLPQHVLRFWETRFSQIKPLKRGGGRRYYRPDDVDLLKGIQYLLYSEGYTIKGVQRILKEQGVGAVVAAPSGGAVSPERAEPAGHEAVVVGRAVGASPHGAASGTGQGERAKLQSVLTELLECKRLLDQSRQTPE